MTNREKLDRMSNEEFAEKICEKGMCGICIIGSETCDKNCERNIIKWLDKEIEPTADEMFEELMFFKKKDTPSIIEYVVKHKLGSLEAEFELTIARICDEYRYKFINPKGNIPQYIGEKLHKAIHKKIEELKNNET